MQEVVDELVKGLTQEDLKGRLVVILAGYESDIDAMLRVNQGLKSRFNEKVVFEDLSPAAAAGMLKGKVAALGLVLSAQAEGAAEALMAQLAALPGFGNGRDVETVAKRAYTEHAQNRQAHSKEGGRNQPGAAAAAADDGDGGGGEFVVSEASLRAAVGWLVQQRLPPGQAAAVAAAAASASLPSSTAAAAPGADATGAEQRLRLLTELRAQQPGQSQQAFAASPPPPVLATVTAVAKVEVAAPPPTQEEQQEEEVPAAAAAPLPADESLWAGFPPAFLTGLQAALDGMGLNSQDAVRRIAGLPQGSEELARIASEISRKSGGAVSPEEALDLLREWQERYGSVEEGLRQQEEETAKAHKEGRMAMVPIWRCAACGRADKPWIACYYSPFIVRYQPTVLQ